MLANGEAPAPPVVPLVPVIPVTPNPKLWRGLGRNRPPRRGAIERPLYFLVCPHQWKSEALKCWPANRLLTFD
jgi:hypothetical protein